MATKLALLQDGVKCAHVLRREGPPVARWVFCFYWPDFFENWWEHIRGCCGCC